LQQHFQEAPFEPMKHFFALFMLFALGATELTAKPVSSRKSNARKKGARKNRKVSNRKKKPLAKKSAKKPKGRGKGKGLALSQSSGETSSTAGSPSVDSSNQNSLASDVSNGSSHPVENPQNQLKTNNVHTTAGPLISQNTALSQNQGSGSAPNSKNFFSSPVPSTSTPSQYQENHNRPRVNAALHPISSSARTDPLHGNSERSYLNPQPPSSPLKSTGLDVRLEKFRSEFNTFLKEKSTIIGNKKSSNYTEITKKIDEILCSLRGSKSEHTLYSMADNFELIKALVASLDTNDQMPSSRGNVAPQDQQPQDQQPQNQFASPAPKKNTDVHPFNVANGYLNMYGRRRVDYFKDSADSRNEYYFVYNNLSDVLFCDQNGKKNQGSISIDRKSNKVYKNTIYYEDSFFFKFSNGQDELFFYETTPEEDSRFCLASPSTKSPVGNHVHLNSQKHKIVKSNNWKLVGGYYDMDKRSDIYYDRINNTCLLGPRTPTDPNLIDIDLTQKDHRIAFKKYLDEKTLQN
jgi:hypothetical protein